MPKKPPKHPDLHQRLKRLVGTAVPTISKAKPSGLARGEHDQLVRQLELLATREPPLLPTRRRRS